MALVMVRFKQAWHQRVIIFLYKIRQDSVTVLSPPPAGWALLFSTHYGIDWVRQIRCSDAHLTLRQPHKMVNSLVSELYRKQSDFASDVSIPLFDAKLKVKAPGASKGSGNVIWTFPNLMLLFLNNQVSQKKKNQSPKEEPFPTLPRELRFPLKWNAHFHLTQTIPEMKPVGTPWLTHSQPRSKIQTNQLFFSWNSGGEALAGKTRQGPDTLPSFKVETS